MLGVELMHKAKRADRMEPGIIVNIASVVGLDPWQLMPIYTASKHAIVGFSRAFSVSLMNLRFSRPNPDIIQWFPAWKLLRQNGSQDYRIVPGANENYILETNCRKHDLPGWSDGRGIFQKLFSAKVRHILSRRCFGKIIRNFQGGNRWRTRCWPD